MKRYNTDMAIDIPYMVWMSEHPEGEYVKYEDAATEIEKARADEREQVQEWHPKCDTCEHVRDYSPDTGMPPFVCSLTDIAVSIRYYCADHSAFAGTDED
jgi:hypothetical protein